MLVADFRVRAPLYFGPVDLLLYLVRRHEVDIREIALTRVADDFLELVQVLEILDLDGIGDFLVTASALLELKARLLLPSPEEEVVEDDDEVSGDLIRKLLEYRRFRDASLALEQQAAAWQERYPRLSSDRPSEQRDLAQDQIREVELWDLVSALARVIKRTDADEESRIRREDTPISVYADRIRSRLHREPRVAFSSFFEGEKARARIVGIFLAILELLRHHHYRAEQPIEHGEIWVLPPDDSQRPADQSEVDGREAAAEAADGTQRGSDA